MTAATVPTPGHLRFTNGLASIGGECVGDVESTYALKAIDQPFRIIADPTEACSIELARAVIGNGVITRTGSVVMVERSDNLQEFGVYQYVTWAEFRWGPLNACPTIDAYGSSLPVMVGQGITASRTHQEIGPYNDNGRCARTLYTNYYLWQDELWSNVTMTAWDDGTTECYVIFAEASWRGPERCEWDDPAVFDPDAGPVNAPSNPLGVVAPGATVIFDLT